MLGSSRAIIFLKEYNVRTKEDFLGISFHPVNTLSLLDTFILIVSSKVKDLVSNAFYFFQIFFCGSIKNDFFIGNPVRKGKIVYI